MEFSPDGPPDYFCTESHWEVYRDYKQAKGLAWRASPLEKIDKKYEDNQGFPAQYK